jgi:ABC-type branched-subunit amino acid transport system substrate-binding protein
LTSAVAAFAAIALALSPAEEAGKRIYLHGEATSGGEITARVGRSGVVVPGSAVSCGSCHGEDGLGRREGGVAPSQITWSHLTKRAGHVHDLGRRHPPFDAKSLARAIGDGVDPAGNPLDDTMPRYSMSPADMQHLIAYLRRLEHERDPGVENGVLRLGVVVPTTGQLAEAGRAMRVVLESAFAEVNRGGGIHGRRLELVVGGYDSDAASGEDAARRLLAGNRVFALVSGLFPRAEPEIAALAEREKVPLVAPLTVTAASPPHPAGAWAFYAAGGLREQVRALVKHAVSVAAPAKPRLAVVHAPGDAHALAIAAAREGARASGLADPQVHVLDPGTAAALTGALQAEGVGAVLFLGDDTHLADLTNATAQASFAPRLLVPGMLASRAALEAPPAVAERTFLAFPGSPSAAQPAAAAALDRITAQAELDPRHRHAQVAALTAAELVKEALRRTGRAVSRASLVAALEGIQGFSAGFGPPLTFGPNRRVGAAGAYVVVPDPAARTFREVGWIATE